MTVGNQEASNMKCADCGQEILQTHPEMCPYCRGKNLISDEEAVKTADQLANAGQYEEAALSYEKLDLWAEAKECRQLAKKKHLDSSDLAMAKVESVDLICPHCGASQAADPKLNEQTCKRCGTEYKIPEIVQRAFE
jgi:DNA-directed RNA polymerase subunit RPC12/RpoP